MKMEWIWPIRGMVGKLVLYILIRWNDIRKSWLSDTDIKKMSDSP